MLGRGALKRHLQQCVDASANITRRMHNQAINAAAALRTVATNFPCSSSIIIEESSSARSDNVTAVSAPGPAVTSVTPNDSIHEGSSTTFREKEKEKEGTKSKKSTLSLLRLKYSSANKKSRR